MSRNQEEFERRNPRSEALRAAQAQEFLDRMSEITSRNREAYQKEIPGIDALLMQLRGQGVPENLSIDQMKALGLYVPEYRSTSLSDRPLQKELPVQSNVEPIGEGIKGRLIQEEIDYLKKEAIKAGIPFEELLYDGTVENRLSRLAESNNPKGIANTLKQEEFNRAADIPSVKRAVQQIESTPIPRSVGGNRMAGRLGKLLIPLITGTSAGVLLDDVIDANQAERMPVPVDKESVAKLAAAELLAQAVS